MVLVILPLGARMGFLVAAALRAMGSFEPWVGRMCLVINDDVIEACAAQSSDHPFAGAVLPRASKAGLFGSDTQAFDEGLHGSEHRVVVKKEEAGQCA